MHYHRAKTDLFLLCLLGEICFFRWAFFGFRFVCLVIFLVSVVSVQWRL